MEISRPFEETKSLAYSAASPCSTIQWLSLLTNILPNYVGGFALHSPLPSMAKGHPVEGALCIIHEMIIAYIVNTPEPNNYMYIKLYINKL